MKALKEEAEKAGIESGKTDLASVQKNTKKKKVMIVKKIVKRKVIKKVPKRVPVASHCNDIEKVASPNPNDNLPMEAEAFVPVEIEKPNVVVNDIREVENTKELEASDREKDIRLIENSDCCMNESDRSDLATASLLDDQNRIDLHEHEINNIIDVEEDAGEDSVKEHESLKKVDDSEDIDLKPSDAVEGHDGMEVLNTETDGLKSQGSNEGQDASTLQMKHRSKIFIHGLDNETKEEDIRKVFEEVGEVIQVKLITNFRSGKNRGFGFIRYASSDFAKLALKKYNNVEICGRLCTTAAVDWSDTILLNNINKNWNNEHILTLLQKGGIKNIDKVSIIPDPKNPKLNLGFAYLELETKRDAQIVYKILQKKNIFGTHSNIKVTWVQTDSLTNPVVKEEIHRPEKSTDSIKVSLTKSIPKVKPVNTTVVKQRSYLKPHKPQNMKKPSINGYEDVRKKLESSTTDELVRILREQASWKHGGPSLTLTPDMNNGNHHHHHQHQEPPFGGKQPFTQLGNKSLYHNPLSYHQTHHQIPTTTHPRPTGNGVAMNFDPQHVHYTSGSYNVVGSNPRYFQTRDQDTYYGSSSSIYRHMR